jgi:hypothetical protein
VYPAIREKLDKSRERQGAWLKEEKAIVWERLKSKRMPHAEERSRKVGQNAWDVKQISLEGRQRRGEDDDAESNPEETALERATEQEKEELERLRTEICHEIEWRREEEARRRSLQDELDQMQRRVVD